MFEDFDRREEIVLHVLSDRNYARGWCIGKQKS